MKETADGEARAPLTEPLIVPCLACDGSEAVLVGGTVRLVGWVDVPAVGSDQPERRVVARLALSPEAARELAGALRGALRQAGH